VARLLFTSSQNRGFHRVALLACLMTFALIILGLNSIPGLPFAAIHHLPRIELLHRYLTYLVGILVLGLTLSAPFYQKELSVQPFLIGLILVPLAASQILLCMLHGTSQARPLIILLHFLVGVLMLSLLWWMARVTSPDAVPSNHSSNHKLRPWAWLALLFLLLQIALGAWISANFNGVICSDFPYCHGQLIPTVNKYTLTALTSPWKKIDNSTLTDIHLIQHLGILMTAIYLGLFSIILLFNRYVYPTALLMILLLGGQVTMDILNLGWNHPQSTFIWYNALSLLLLLAVISLLTHLYRKSRDYWYG
jgi:cytochrome c oxidase assembly protein subunit 15